MAQKPILRKPEPLTAAIIAYMKTGEQRFITLGMLCHTISRFELADFGSEVRA
jgi:hypothetical protein